VISFLFIYNLNPLNFFIMWKDNADFEGGSCGICMDVVIDRGVLDCCQHWYVSPYSSFPFITCVCVCVRVLVLLITMSSHNIKWRMLYIIFLYLFLVKCE
jgi:hypothetical protein